MRKKTLPAALLALALLGGCAGPAGEPPLEGNTGTPDLPWEEAPARVSCRIVDGAGEGELLLAELDRPLTDGEDSRHDGKSVYRLSLAGEACREKPGPNGETAAETELRPIAVYLDGRPATAADLTDGMPVEVVFLGAVEETFPARLGNPYELHAYSIGTAQNPGGGYYDLCGLYLQVLDDLWEKDPGLNDGITVAGLDLSEAPGGVLDSEKAALCWRFGETHGVETVAATFGELAEGGYLTPVSPEGETPLYRWEDGCLFTITADQSHEDEAYSGPPILFFDAQKWRSPLGAYYFGDCSALWPEMGSWSGYKVGHEAIS